MYIPPLAIFVTGWLIGVGLAPNVSQPAWAWLLLSLAGLAGALVMRRRAAPRNIAIALVLCGLGGARAVWAQPTFDETFIATYNDSGAATVEGVVVDEPDVRDTYVNLRVEADSLRIEGAGSAIPIHGTVLVQVPRYPAINFGDRIRAHGELQAPPRFEDFNYADYLARQGVFSILRRANAETISDAPITNAYLRIQIALFKPIYALKSRALAAIAATFPEPQGALLSGILLGVETGIPESLKDAFRATGTSHIVAISGFNISIIVKVFAGLFKRIAGEKRSIPLTIVTVAIYTLLAGADASVVRAALMGSIVVLSDGFNRRANGLASLAAACFLMTAFNPGSLYDVGFQLSVAATLGLIVYATPFTQAATNYLSRFTQAETAERIIGVVGEFSLLTIAAQVTTLPLMAFYFHQISLISLLANLLVLPAQPFVMVAGGIAAICGMIAQPLGALVAWLAWPFVTFTIAMVELLAKVPLAAIPIDRFSVAALFGMYAVLTGLTWLFTREPEKRPRWFPAASGLVSSLGVAALGAGALAAWNVYLHQPDGRLHVTFFDVGNGDAILIETPSGRYALIDGGPSPNALAESLGRVLPVGVRTLDLVVAASPDVDSIGGLPGLLSRYDIEQVVMAGDPQRTSAYREWTEGVSSQDIPMLTAKAGQQFDLGDGALLQIIHVRADGATLRIDYGNASFLLPVELDAASATELATTGQIRQANALLAPRHGGENSISALFLDAAQPSAVIISVGAGNTEGDPHAQTLALLEGRTVLRTDRQGTISFATDGTQLWAVAER